MPVKVECANIKQLFSGSWKLCIPEYQRAYCWGDRQLEELLEGIKYDLLHTDFSYLGSIILHKDEQGYFNIIDGQQRITSLALIAFIRELYNGDELKYISPESQWQIMKNLAWLHENHEKISQIDFEKIEVTLVITESEDEAYQFFETQNTGGVRLGGADIIKAYHLQALDQSNKVLVNESARLWESLGSLNDVLLSLLRGRYWQKLMFKDIPSHRRKHERKLSLIDEFTKQIGVGEDIAYGRSVKRCSNGQESITISSPAYALRQPLHEGINTIHYIKHFKQLDNDYLTNPAVSASSEIQQFHAFYTSLVCQLHNCAYLKQLYDVCLLMHLSQYGEQDLAQAARKLFRVVYALRLSNRKAVREQSVIAFVRETPILDWIDMSYTPQQYFAILDQFHLQANSEGVGKNTAKQRFINQVCKFQNCENRPETPEAVEAMMKELAS